jgi:hypothetical protein
MKASRAAELGAVVLAPILAGVLWVSNCSGPRPEVGDVRLTAPTGEGSPYRLETTVHNRGPGHGQVVVTFRLRDPATGRTVQSEERIVLDRGETSLVTTEILAPPAAYESEAEAEFPPT